MGHHVHMLIVCQHYGILTLQATSIGPYFRMKLNWVAGLFDILPEELGKCTVLRFIVFLGQHPKSNLFWVSIPPLLHSYNILFLFPCPDYFSTFPTKNSILPSWILIPSLTIFYPKPFQWMQVAFSTVSYDSDTLYFWLTKEIDLVQNWRIKNKILKLFFAESHFKMRKSRFIYPRHFIAKRLRKWKYDVQWHFFHMKLFSNIFR